MKLHELRAVKGATKAPKRKGRGPSEKDKRGPDRSELSGCPI